MEQKEDCVTPLCNDVLTRIGTPPYGKDWPERQFRVGDKGDKNGMSYTVKAFGVSLRHTWKGNERVYKLPASIWLIVKYKGDRAHKWDMLLIGDSNCFKEKLVLGGRHPNPVFDRYWPKEWKQPL